MSKNDSIKARIFLFLLPLLFSFSVVGQGNTDLFELKDLITFKIDSLEVEKQNYLRLGKSVDSIEDALADLKDSIVAIKITIATDNSKKRKYTIPFKLGTISDMRPANTLDWIIVIVGGMALFSGIVLIIGIFAQLSKRRKHLHKKTNAPAPLQNWSHAAVVKPPPEVPIVPTSDSISRLRKQISDTIPSYEKESRSPFLDESSSSRLNASEANGNLLSIEETIFKAIENGCDIQEISRRFHLSTDQVSLMMKVAQKKSVQKKS